MRPARLHELIASLPPCVIGMEACSGAHHWARLFQASGHTVRLIAPKFVTPYRMAGKGGKNDAADAAAICEAAGRPHMRFVPVKTPAQQALLFIHRLREGYKEDRTACINRIRGLLTEFGIVFAQSPEALRLGLADVLEDASNELPGIARLALQEARLHWIELECHIASCDERITAHVRSDEQAKAAAQLAGIGPVTASALVATVGDFRQFKNGAQFGSWLGLVPRQNSSGGKTVLGRITKRGDDYLRTLLIQGAKSAVMTVHKRGDKISQWLVHCWRAWVARRPLWRWPTRTLASSGRCWPRGACSTRTTCRSSRVSCWRYPSRCRPENPLTNEQVLPVDVRSEMQFTGQTGSRQARLTLCRARGGDGGERMEPC